MISNKEQFEQEIYRLLSLRGGVNANQIDGIGISYDKDIGKSRISIVLFDGTSLIGKQFEKENIEEMFNMIEEVSDNFFKENGVLIAKEKEQQSNDTNHAINTTAS